jgi:hypothetical protein
MVIIVAYESKADSGDWSGMRREPSLTFEGALRILGHHEHSKIETINKLLGGLILGTGAATGLVALGITPLAPLAAFGAVWGWVDQKGLAVDLLESVIDAVSDRVSGLGGVEKRELIAASHSTIVVAAIFESLRIEVGEKFYEKLKITESEKMSVISHMGQAKKQALIEVLYVIEVPAPSAAVGFEENVENVGAWQKTCITYVQEFIDGLAVAKRVRINWEAVSRRAIQLYKSRYLDLAVKVPEFAIWALLREHAATRKAVGAFRYGVDARLSQLSTDITGARTAAREANANILAALRANGDALNRIAVLLSDRASGGSVSPTATGISLAQAPLLRLRATVSRANAGALAEAVIPPDPERYPAGITIPRVSEIYVNPRYRVAKFVQGANPANEAWWDSRASRNDFDVMLTAHVTSPDATRLPMLLLGHPGAGKSLLTKVFAARLPDSEYTTVRVPLRRVDADARIHRQIEEALEVSTDQRIAWSDLADESRDTIRVVLLDGLDELLQASEHDRSSYLDDVAEFQEREAVQGRPVVVMVTSRTVVADRVRIPDGATVAKLDPFDEDNIHDWVTRWNRVNADAVARKSIGKLSLSSVRRQSELTEQPLLLLMLALYAADQTLPPLHEELSTAELYRRLLEGFARREAAKDLGLGHDPRHDVLDGKMQDHLGRLAIAAFGMFNRGRQDISEVELSKDIEVLEPRLLEQGAQLDVAKRIIGEFFFVHAPEARTLNNREPGGGQPQRAYEFLHATFGEYLVAQRIIDEILQIPGAAISGRRGRIELHDDMLFALLSHQTLAARRSMLDFAQQIFIGIESDGERARVLDTLELLVSTYRNRHGSDRYLAYRPIPLDHLRELACYSANLISLRVMLESGPDGVPLTQLLRISQDALASWQSTPNLWKTGLDIDGLQAMMTSLELVGIQPRLRTMTSHELATAPLETALARLTRDKSMEDRLRYGAAIVGGITYYYEGDSWVDAISSGLIRAITGGMPSQIVVAPPPDGTSEMEIKHVADLIFMFLKSKDSSHRIDAELLRFLFTLPRVYGIDELALTVATLSDPGLVKRVPQLQDHNIYGKYAAIVRRDLTSKNLPSISRRRLSDEAIAAVREVLSIPQPTSTDTHAIILHLRDSAGRDDT